MKFPIILIAIIPILDRFLTSFNYNYLTQRAADIVVISLFFYFVIVREKFKVTKKAFNYCFVIFLFGLIFGIRDISMISLRQSVSLIIMSAYVYLIILLATRVSYHYVAKTITWTCFFNCCFMVIVGFFPDTFGFLVNEISKAGRTILGYKMPVVRNAGLFNHYGYLGAYLITSLLMLVYLLKNRHISKFKFFVFLFVYVSAVIVSQSRAIFISTSLCILAQSLFLLRINPKYIVVISAFFVWLYIEHLIAVWELIISIKSSNFYSRMNQISIGVRIFSENIFFGGGYSEYFKYTDKHVLHNMVVTILSSNGLLGIILFFIINITIVLKHLRSKEFVQILVCFFAIHLVLNASSGLSFYSFWLFIGVAYAFPANRIGSLNG